MFVRKSDGVALQSNYESRVELPNISEETQEVETSSFGSTVAGVGMGALILSAFLSYFSFLAQNKILSQVRSLGLITHLMMMQLNYPQPARDFFKAVFPMISFDLVPGEALDWIYGKLFNLNSTAYSPEAEWIGYGSRWIAENSGSITVFLFLLFLFQLLMKLVIVCFANKRWIHKYATK